MLWGFGGLTFGLTMRYLGMSLGMAMVLGYTAAFGTLLPPIFRGVFATEVWGTHSGQVILLGVAVCLAGIVCAGSAGVSKEREMPEEQKRTAIREFNLKRGVLVATFSGVMSACFAYGLAAGDPIKEITMRHGTPPLWQGLPVLVVVLAGGFTTNFIWCLILNIRNRTGYQYFQSEIRAAAPARGGGERRRRAVPPGGRGGSRHRTGGQGPDAGELPLQRARRNHLVHAVLLLQHGRNADGPVQVFELDAAHGQHHHLQHAVGHRAQGVDRHQPPHQNAGRHSAWLVLVSSTMIVGYGNYLGVAGK